MQFHCDECGADKDAPIETIGAGYARDNRGRKICYECCAKHDVERMKAKGSIVLYLTTREDGSCKITNWPGSLSFDGRYRVGRHNIARKRYDATFIGPDGAIWVGVTYGDMTQICRCFRTKYKKHHGWKSRASI